MKFRNLCNLTLVILSLSFIVSCDKNDDFLSIKTVERDIHTRVNNYRASEGLSTLVEQYDVFKKAREVSDKLANGTYEIGDSAIQDFVENFAANLGGSSSGFISLASSVENAESVVNAMISDSGSREILRQEFTQSGVGVTEGEDGFFYVCHIFINIPY